MVDSGFFLRCFFSLHPSLNRDGFSAGRHQELMHGWETVNRQVFCVV